MIVGDPSRFAIESSITKAYARLSLRGLGYFVIYVDGVCYGRRTPDSTALACSYDEVVERCAQRGRHVAEFASERDAWAIADAWIRAIYAPEVAGETFCGLSRADLARHVHAGLITWAPDGDEAFDDSSCVLQFDVGDMVRLIAFTREIGYGIVPDTLKDLRLGADEFYETLQKWHRTFLAEWTAAPKANPNAPFPES